MDRSILRGRPARVLDALVVEESCRRVASTAWRVGQAPATRVSQRKSPEPDLFSSPKNTARRERLQTPRQRKMILTNCAACAAPLAHNAPRCVRCHTRYLVF